MLVLITKQINILFWYTFFSILMESVSVLSQQTILFYIKESLYNGYHPNLLHSNKRWKLQNSEGNMRHVVSLQSLLYFIKMLFQKLGKWYYVKHLSLASILLQEELENGDNTNFKELAMRWAKIVSKNI